MKNNYYVYMHRRASDGLPFYIGKGRGYRSRDKHGRNIHWKRVVAKHGYTIEILHSNLNEDESKLLEVMEINNKRSLGYPMTNINNGGDGNHGWIPSEETKRKIGMGNAGKVISEETREKMREAQLGRKHSEETKEKMRIWNLNRGEDVHKEIGLKRRDKEEFVFLDTKQGGVGFVIGTRQYMIENYGLNASKVSDLIVGRRKQHKGWILLNHTPKPQGKRK